MDRVAAALRLDPVELRLKNMVEPFDTDLVTGLPLGDARVRECLERGAVAFDWAARRARPAGRGRLRRGVGVAAGAHKNGMFGAFPEASNMSLKMNEDGTFELNASLHDPGLRRRDDDEGHRRRGARRAPGPHRRGRGRHGDDAVRLRHLRQPRDLRRRRSAPA